MQRFKLSKEEVLKRLGDKMVKALNEGLSYSEEYEAQMRKAALILAVNRVAEAVKFLGIWP